MCSIIVYVYKMDNNIYYNAKMKMKEHKKEARSD